MEDGSNDEINKSKLRLVTPASQVGSDLTARYRLVDLIGSGATSSVFEGFDKESEERVAIKALHAHLVDRQDVVERFEREAKTAAALNHPSIVRIFDRTKTELGQPILIMEYVEGDSLQDVMKSCGGSLPVGRAINIFLQIAGALAAAHEKRIVHRDLKPQNIMVDCFSGDKVKVLDFGIAKALGPQGDTFFKMTQSGETLGSLLYMSPEQCLDEDVDERSDIYALGCLMYETLMGKPPLSGRTAFETMNAQLSQRPAAFKTVRPEKEVSRRLENIIFKAMEKRATDRFQTIGELIDELREENLRQEESSSSKRRALALVDIEPDFETKEIKNSLSKVNQLPVLNFAEELYANIHWQSEELAELKTQIRLTVAVTILSAVSLVGSVAGLYPHGREALAAVASGAFLFTTIVMMFYLKHLVRIKTMKLESIKKNLRYLGSLNEIRLVPEKNDSGKSAFEVAFNMRHKNGNTVLYRAIIRPQRALSARILKNIAAASEFYTCTKEGVNPLPLQVVVFFDDVTNRPVACAANGAFAVVVSSEAPELLP